MNNFLNILDDFILVINKLGEILFLNDSFSKRFDYNPKDILRKDVGNLLFSDNCVDILKLLNKNIGEELKLTIVSKNNSYVNVKSKVCRDYFGGTECIFISSKEDYKKPYKKQDLEKFLDEIPFMVAIKNKEGKYVYINNFTKKLICDSDGEYKTKSYEEMLNYKDIEKVAYEDHEVIKTKEIRYYEKCMEAENGEKKFFEVYKIPILDEDGRVTHMGKFSRDVSLVKRLESDINISYSELTNLSDLSNYNIINYNRYNCLRDIQKYIVNNVNACGSNIWILDDDKKNLISTFRYGICDEINEGNLKIDFCSEEFEKRFLKGNFEGLQDISAIEEYTNREILLRNNVRYSFLYRITVNNELLGILSILFKDKEKSINTKESFIKIACNQMGMIIKNLKLTNELKEEFDKRREIEKELEIFLETATDLMAVIDIRGNFKKVNKECIDILGYTREELLKMKWQDIINENELLEVDRIVSNSFKNSSKAMRGVNRYKCKNKEEIWIQWGAKYLKDKKVYICTGRDITEQIKLEEQKSKYEASIHLEKIRNEFFANVSHEFKTPLNIILTTMQLVNRSIDNGEIKVNGNIDLKKYMNSIKQNSYRLLRLVNNLIDITRIDTGYYKLHLENNNIVSIIEDITMSVAQYIENKGISLIFDTEVEEEIIACDPDKIERIMLNLLSNAIKYTDENGEIDVDIKVSSSDVIVSVKDNGIGIPKEKLDGVFDRFVRVDNLLTRQCEGSGIGLALVKSLVEMHGGNICVNSEVNKGTEFTFNIPIKKVNEGLKANEITLDSRIEKCIIEFSDIYR